MTETIDKGNISVPYTEVTEQNTTKEYLAYNTTSEPLKLPEYGRLVLQMVEFALTIENRDERTAYAKKIIRVMGGLNPQMKHVPDYQYKLWDHLAYLSDYKLDIDYPVEIRRYGEKSHPNRLSYPGNRIKLRHYGHLVELLLGELMEKLDSPARPVLIAQCAARMRRNLVEWKGDTADDEKIARDIAHYTQGKVNVPEVLEIIARQPRSSKHGKRN